MTKPWEGALDRHRASSLPRIELLAVQEILVVASTAVVQRRGAEGVFAAGGCYSGSFLDEGALFG